MRTWTGLIAWVLLCFAAAALGGLFTGASLTEWYAALRKPAWNPPNWVFGPVWSVLYLTMAVAAWLVWRGAGTSRALAVFVLQLILNVAWSGIFFGLRSPGAAFAEIVALWGVLAVTVVLFWRVSSVAGWLMVPYLAWVTFAAALNFTIWRLNH